MVIKTENINIFILVNIFGLSKIIIIIFYQESDCSRNYAKGICIGDLLKQKAKVKL